MSEVPLSDFCRKTLEVSKVVEKRVRHHLFSMWGHRGTSLVRKRTPPRTQPQAYASGSSEVLEGRA